MFKREDLVVLLKEHWNRTQTLKEADERDYFQALFDCFEVLVKLETDNYEKIDWVKLSSTSNSIKEHFLWMVRMENSLSHIWTALIRVERYSPYENNTSGKNIIVKDLRNFSQIMEALRTVRNNLRHGMKEYTPRSKEIIDNFNIILYWLIYEPIKKHIPSNNTNKSFVTWDSILYTIIFFLFLFVFLFGGLFIKPQKNVENCNWQYTQDWVNCD